MLINNILQKQWVVLHQFSHANKYLVDLLCRKLFGSTNKYNELGEWKLWLSTDIDEITEVPSILKYCYRIAMDEPKVLNAIYCINYIV